MTLPIAVPASFTSTIVDGTLYVASNGTIDVTGASPADVAIIVATVASLSGPITVGPTLVSASFNIAADLILQLSNGLTANVGALSFDSGSNLYFTQQNGQVIEAGQIPGFTIGSTGTNSSSSAHELVFANQNNSAYAAAVI